MNPVYLPSQHAAVHDLPVDADRLRTVLDGAVATAMLHQQSDGNFEDPAADDDIGDMSLGVTSLLCLSWHRGDRRDAELVDAVRRSMDYFLAHRVFRTDNPGEPFLRIRNSGEPYARYVPATGEHPFGDWPSTVWAMLHAVNVLELGHGLLTEAQYAELTGTAVGYWRWLTQVSLFNPQQTANQAIGAVAGGLMLGRHLRSEHREKEGERIAGEAMALYTEVIRPARVPDRGFLLPLEHGAGHDQNYVPISLTFLAQAYRVSGEQCFLDDGEQIARHLECRLSARGFDFGGPRYSEQHCGAEGMLGLRFFSSRIRAELGRYLGDRRVSYYPLAATGAPSGHFAFASVWLWQDDGDWYRGTDMPHHTPYSLRHGKASVSLTEDLTPYQIDAGGTVVIESITDHQHGIGPVVRYPDGRSLLLTRPLGPMRSRDASVAGLAAKLVTKAVVTHDQILLSVQQLYVSDGERIHVFAVLDRAALPADAELAFLAGLPYVEAEGERQRKILAVSEPDGAPFDLGRPGAVLEVGAGSLLAGGMAVTAAAGLRVVNPPEGRTHFNSPETIGLTQEQVAFALADDPRGYGNPDSGWRRVTQTNQVLVHALGPDAPSGPAVFALSYGPAADADGGPFRVTAESVEQGVLVRTPRFTALIGHPAGDEHGEPVLRLTAAGSGTAK
ncbi:hypothetical protein [Streptacidiphilus sp. EB103A]|uniref:hypothetical protein n=1 Tax=Streptacidiphilus sp. EB103A TaxID=3156275 RepID=UPI0035121F83